MSFDHFTVEDFLENESFQSFALSRHVDDVIFWNDWIEAHPEKKAEFDEARATLTAFAFREREVGMQVFADGLDKLKKAIEPAQKNSSVTSIRASKPYLRIAAAIALLIGVTAGAYQYVTYFKEKSNYITLDKSTPKGSKLTVILPDGTKVKLNGGSHLTYNQNDIVKYRKVILEGEAFFEVKEDTQRPFTVVTGDISTTALGTSFNIESYPGDPYTKIYLVTGKVKIDHKVNSQTEQFVLSPGEGVNYDGASKKVTVVKLPGDEVLAWRNGIIRFKGAGIAEVATTLERWYGVNIIIINAPSDKWQINGTFENESLENVLRSLQYTTSMEYSLEKNMLTLTFN